MKSFLPVLVFDRIGKAPTRTAGRWTSTRALEKWFIRLQTYGYQSVSMTDLQHLPSQPILLLFVGGYQSFYTEVFPLLKKYNFRATCALAVDTLGTYNSWQDPHQEPWQNVLTAAQVKELAQSGLVEIATMGLDGKNISSLPPQHAQQEIAESIYRLKTLHQLTPKAIVLWPGTRCKDFSLLDELSLPIISGKCGANTSAKSPLRVLHPTWFTRIRLRFHR